MPINMDGYIATYWFLSYCVWQRCLELLCRVALKTASLCIPQQGHAPENQ